MLDDTLAQQIAQIHATPPKLVFDFAGAGSLALRWLHAVAGSSRTILEATDRYAAPSMADLIGHTPEKSVSRATAELMAQQAYHRAVRLGDGDVPVLGVALTATIATDRVKRGDHGCWVAVCDSRGLRAYGLTFVKGARARDGEEHIASTLAIRAIAEATGVSEVVPLALTKGETIKIMSTPQPDPIVALLAGSLASVTVAANGARSADAPVHGALLSGSFNPLHQGHERLAEAAATLLDMPVAFEMPIVNADKPPLRYNELERRLEQFKWRVAVVLSRAPLFVDKARLFPGCVFVIGYDTALRLIDLHYYGGEPGRDIALAAIRDAGCRLLVAGRVDTSGVFRTLHDLALPAAFADMFLELPESAFHIDMSSTAIRAMQGSS